MRGFRGFRRAETISEDALKSALERIGLEGRFIYWTGNPYNSRKESLRSNSLKALNAPKVAVPMKDWIREAARVVDGEAGIGYDPAALLAGIYVHLNSMPSVYFELYKVD